MRSPTLSETNRPTLRQRLELRGARLLFALPAFAQRRLSGRRPVIIQGQTLHPQMQLLLALREVLRPGLLSYRTATESRRELRREILAIGDRPIEAGRVSDLSIKGGAGSLRARHYAPAAQRPRPLLVFFHGGGFVAGDVETHDGVCRRLCRYGDVHVLSVEYRLAPESPFPAAVDDAVAAFRWACAEAASLGAVPDKIAVGGDSAGGNLAAVVSLKAKAGGGPAPCAQVLLYPVLDRTTVRPSLELFGDGFLLTRDSIDWYQLQYTGTTVAQPIPDQYPLCAADFSGLAPALIVTAGFDPLRDEGEAYADVLRQAGVPVTLRRFDGLLHGFCNMAPVSRVCEAAVRQIGADLRAIMGNGDGRRLS